MSPPVLILPRPVVEIEAMARELGLISAPKSSALLPSDDLIIAAIGATTDHTLVQGISERGRAVVDAWIAARRPAGYTSIT